MKKKFSSLLVILFCAAQVINAQSLETTAGRLVEFTNTNDAVTGALRGIPLTHFTLTAWVKPDGFQSDYDGIFISDEVEPIGLCFVGTNNRIGYNWPSGQVQWLHNLFVEKDKWNYVAMVIEPDSATVYVNGKYSSHVTPLDTGFLTTFKLGQFQNYVGRDFKGQIDEIKIWSRALTQTDIRKQRHLILTQAEVNDPTLLAYYQFNTTETRAYNVVNGDTLGFVGGVLKSNSDAPVGVGTQDVVQIDTPGQYVLPNTETKITFSSTAPVGQIVVNYIQGSPTFLPEGLALPGYYIVNNYSDNTVFSPLDSLVFEPGGFSPENDLLKDKSKAIMYRREENGFEDTWQKYATASSVSSTEIGFGNQKYPGNSITEFGQWFVTTDRCAYDVKQYKLCEGDSFEVDGVFVNTNGVYYNRVRTSPTCETVEELFLSFKPPVYGSDNREICSGDSILLGSVYRKTAGAYIDTVIATFGCDSIIDIQLAISPTINTTVTLNGSTLIAKVNGVNYRWYNCSTNLPVSGADEKYFTPSKGGSYRVHVSNDDCEYVSACHTVTFTGISEEMLKNSVQLFPNPISNNSLTIANSLSENITLTIYNTLGKKVLTHEVTAFAKDKISINISSGIYLYTLAGVTSVVNNTLIVD